MKRTYFNKPHFKKMSARDFWYYYKFHLIAVLFGIILICWLIWDINSAVSPDLLVNYIGWPTISHDIESQMEDQLTSASVLKDVNSDGNIKMDLVSMVIPKFHLDMSTQGDPMQYIEWENKPDDQDAMLMQKIALEMTVGDPALLIMDEGVAQLFLTEGVFVNLDEISTNHEVISGSTKLDESPHQYAIKVEGNRFLENLGFDTQGKYLAVKTISMDQENKPDQAQMLQQAKETVVYLLAQQ